MDLLLERSMLLMVVYISTTVLLTVRKGWCDECDYSSDDYYCARCNHLDDTNPACLNRHQDFSTQQSYCEFIPGKTTTNYTCPNHINCDEGSWFKAEKCGKQIKLKKISEEGVLSFGNCFHPNDQGKYFCLMNGRDGCQNFSNPPVFVTMQGVDKYLGTFKFRGNIGQNNCRCRMLSIVEWVKSNLCSRLQAVECSFVPHRHLNNQSGCYVEGYLYLANDSNISPLHMNHNGPYQEISLPCDNPPGLELTLTNWTFEHVSFCKSESIDYDSAGTLTFSKTKVGRMANSSELCQDKTPRATRFCQGDFITLSYWAVPDEVKNCTRKNDNDDSIKTTKNVTPTSITYHQHTTTTTTERIPESTESVMTVYTTEEITTLRENINDNVPVTNENVNVVSRMLSENTKNPENVDVVQLVWIAKRLKKISEIGSSSPEVTRHVMQIVENLINVKEDVYEESLSGGTPAMILGALEAQLSNLHKGEANFTDVKSSLGVAALLLERSAFGENVTFGGLFTTGKEESSEKQSDVSVMTGRENFYSKFLATITLPTNLLDETVAGLSDRIPLTFIIHRTSLLFMSSSSKERRHSQSVESLVIAATVENHTITNLSSPVICRFQLPHVAEPMVKSSRKCVFWDFNLANGLGDWSSQGCELVSISEENTGSIIECHCNHLTNFAVLLDIQGDIDHVALDILSIIGCMVSIFSLVITLIVLLAAKKLREQVPQKIIVNLCFALLGLYICFLVGIDQRSLGTGCVIFGALIHYFCLASVAWMCVVATNMYLLFVRVFNADVTGFMWKAMLAAWGVFQ
ncbi:Adhesion G-protein coupled receptor G4 [Holothuria leucospilota]|uniref:Adhesion G-protein coupled receptor G4 n=1 Tax=Holothuria leucospilota TaxID=206669 RepID=A0A9Q0YL51_HOLLE|nr:Adhesion G-protein coupled receptor G4 [Holothuria leucospilota]